MPKINPRIKSIDDLLGLDAAEESPIEPTPSVSLPTKNTVRYTIKNPSHLSITHRKLVEQHFCDCSQKCN